MNFSFIDFITQMFSSLPNFIVFLLLSLGMLVNGLSDAPNTIATCVSTKAISPKKAIIIGVIFNFLGIFVMSLINIEVAETIFRLVKIEEVGKESIIVLVGTLISIISWIRITSYFGIPVTESHALIASLMGASVAYTNTIQSVNGVELSKVFLGIGLSIVLGFITGFCLSKAFEMILKHFNRIHTEQPLKIAQIAGGASMSFMHGAQAGQKFIGVFILGWMLIQGKIESQFTIPVWLMAYCSFLIGIGILIGGHKIIKTVGMKLSNLELYQGVVVDFASSFCLLLASIFGLPISTSHTKSMTIIGTSASRRKSSINWNIIKNIIIAGIITFPCCGLFAYIITKVLLIIT